MPRKLKPGVSWTITSVRSIANLIRTNLHSSVWNQVGISDPADKGRILPQ